MDIQTKDGIVLRGIPDGTPDEAIKARIEKIRAEGMGAAPQPTAAPQLPQAEPAPMLERAARGFAAPFVGTVQAGAKAIGADYPYGSEFAQQSREKAGGELDLAGLLGQATNPINLLAARGGPMLAGAAFGATNPVDESQGGFLEQKATETGLNAAGGKLFNMAGARLLSPETNAAAKSLLQSGVNLTLGQRGGPISKGIEAVVEKTPIIGSLVKDRKTQAIEQWNRKLGSEVMDTIGQKLPKTVEAGHDLMKHVGDAVSNEYKRVLSAGSAAFDGPMQQADIVLNQMIKKLPVKEARQARQIIDNYVIDPITKSGRLTGAELQQAVATLRDLSQKYSRSTAPLDGEIGKIVTKARQALIGSFERNSPPAVGQAFQKVRSAYASLVPMEKAAATAKGAFDPKQLLSAITSKAPRKTAAQGRVLGQKQAQEALEVLGTMPKPNNYVDMAAGSVIPGIGAALAAKPAAMAAALSAGAYTKPGMAVANVLMNARPEAVQQLAPLLRKRGGSYTAALVEALRDK